MWAIRGWQENEGLKFSLLLQTKPSIFPSEKGDGTGLERGSAFYFSWLWPAAFKRARLSSGICNSFCLYWIPWHLYLRCFLDTCKPPNIKYKYATSLYWWTLRLFHVLCYLKIYIYCITPCLNPSDSHWIYNKNQTLPRFTFLPFPPHLTAYCSSPCPLCSSGSFLFLEQTRYVYLRTFVLVLPTFWILISPNSFHDFNFRL